jgi:glycosyltransferase EpsF
MRVLQVVESFDTQATEAWLLQLTRLARSSYPEINWTFLCLGVNPGRLERDVLDVGAQLVHARCGLSRPARLLVEVRRIMRLGRFDVLHCHHDVMSAIPLLASVGIPFRKRIVHVHNTAIALPTPNRLKVACLRPCFRQTCLRADNIVGVSQDALDAILAGRAPRPARDRVIHCGIDCERYRRNGAEATRQRMELGFASDSKILLFVGRMIPYKNPTFVVEILKELHRSDPRFAAVFAGTGPCEEEVRSAAENSEIAHRVKILGWRDDIPRLMHACDLFVWPGVEHPKEGLGLGVVEAQAAGLPVLMSLNVPEEAVVIPELVRTLPLSAGAHKWAQTILSLLNQRRPSRDECCSLVDASTFSIQQSLENIVSLYRQKM